MSKTLVISDALAEVLEERRRASGEASINDTAESLIAYGLLAEAKEDHSLGYSDEELRGLIDEARASGPARDWNAAEVRAEVLKRHAVRRSASA